MTSAADLSPNMKIVKAFVENNYGNVITHIGVYNCRRISGSQTFSQHSWPNAIDIHVSKSKRANAVEKANGDRIFKALLDVFGDDLYEKIWWKRNHYNHIHVSTYPKGMYTPPCAGGSLRVKYKNGRIRTMSSIPQTIKGEDVTNMKEVYARLQASLIRAGYDLGNWTPYLPASDPDSLPGADGVWGSDSRNAQDAANTAAQAPDVGLQRGDTVKLV